MKTKPLFLFITLFCFVTISLQAFAGELHAVIKDNEGQTLEDSVITATPLDSAMMPKQKPSDQEVDQVSKEFTPYVKTVYVNTLVLFPNKDDIRHHVYSFSPAKKFELPLYAGTAASPVLFDKAGVVVLGCNIHDWMIAYVYVANTPYFAKSNQNGLASIAQLPAGDYIVKVWHPRMLETEESNARQIRLSHTDNVNLEWQLPLKPAFKIPRASTGRGFGYH